MFRAVDLPM